MSFAHAAIWRRVSATVVLAAAVGGPPGGLPGGPPPPVFAHGCVPAACALERPTDAESAAIRAESDRLWLRYADDPTPLGRQCATLGATMRARAGEVRMLAYMWRAPDADGDLAPVTGDAHAVEAAAGTGRVHIARGYDPLNPDRGLAAIVETARHEFAHLNGLPQEEGWGLDAAAQLAAACGPP